MLQVTKQEGQEKAPLPHKPTVSSNSTAFSIFFDAYLEAGMLFKWARRGDAGITLF